MRRKGEQKQWGCHAGPCMGSARRSHLSPGNTSKLSLPGQAVLKAHVAERDEEVSVGFVTLLHGRIRKSRSWPDAR